MSYLESQLARAIQRERLAQAEQLRHARSVSAAQRARRRAARLAQKAERVARRAEQAASQARLAVARTI